MPRYAILHHEMPTDRGRPTHWDFLLESGDVLRAWALDAEPGVGRTIAARPLVDHRKAYLDYEGPVSDDRGRVTQWDAGTYRLANETGRQLVVTLDGRRLSGTVTISLGEDARWQLEPG